MRISDWSSDVCSSDLCLGDKWSSVRIRLPRPRKPSGDMDLAPCRHLSFQGVNALPPIAAFVEGRSCWQMSTSDPQARRRTTPMGSPVMAKRSPACPVADSTACDLVGKALRCWPSRVTDQPCSAGYIGSASCRERVCQYV